MTAEELRAYVLETHAPLAQAELLESHRRFGSNWPEQWYVGTCDSTVAVLEEELGEELLPFRVVEWGGITIPGRVHDGHCWLQAPDGTIVDPTSEQYGLEPCLISRPGDPLYARYEPPEVVG